MKDALIGLRPVPRDPGVSAPVPRSPPVSSSTWTVVATQFSFLPAIPAVLASGLFSLPDAFDPAAGQAASEPSSSSAPPLPSCWVISIAWLLKFVANHSFAWFALWRIPVGVIVLILLATGTINA